MTDEEKAEEYMNINSYNNIDSWEVKEEIRQAYLEGLEDGRFEKSL